jgi:hypothetical protein
MAQSMKTGRRCRPPEIMSTTTSYGVLLLPCATWEVVLANIRFPATPVSSALQTLNGNAAIRKFERPVLLVRRAKCKFLLQQAVGKNKNHARRRYQFQLNHR